MSHLISLLHTNIPSFHICVNHHTFTKILFFSLSWYTSFLLWRRMYSKATKMFSWRWLVPIQFLMACQILPFLSLWDCGGLLGVKAGLNTNSCSTAQMPGPSRFSGLTTYMFESLARHGEQQLWYKIMRWWLLNSWTDKWIHFKLLVVILAMTDYNSHRTEVYYHSNCKVFWD